MRFQIYTMRDAAQYLDISYDMMVTYVIRQKRIQGERFGRSWAFTQQQLDDFVKTRKGPGSPVIKEYETAKKKPKPKKKPRPPKKKKGPYKK